MKALDWLLFGVVTPLIIFSLIMMGISIGETIQRGQECDELGGVMYRSLCLEEDAVLIG